MNAELAKYWWTQELVPILLQLHQTLRHYPQTTEGGVREEYREVTIEQVLDQLKATTQNPGPHLFRALSEIIEDYNQYEAVKAWKQQQEPVKV